MSFLIDSTTVGCHFDSSIRIRSKCVMFSLGLTCVKVILRSPCDPLGRSEGAGSGPSDQVESIVCGYVEILALMGPSCLLLLMAQ